MTEKTPKSRSWLDQLGPGLVTGAADDDPSGIATYSQAGAKFGYELGWTLVLTYPLMVAVQMVSARLGRVTGRGLADNIRENFPAPVLYALVVMLLVANTINVAADIAAMGQSLQLVVGGPSQLYAVAFGVVCLVLEIYLSYRSYVSFLKWLTLALFAYVAVALVANISWWAVLSGIFWPKIAMTSDMLTVIVAVFGTTISPYLFFWQAGQEVEEEKAKGRRLVVHRRGATSRELVDRRIDVGVGTFFSNLVMFFIILTTALTLHRHGIQTIYTTRDAATALRPFAGDYAYFLYTLGIVGTGLLAIPTLAGSAAYAIAETFDWAYGLDERFENAVLFYSVFILATVVGAALDFFNVDPIKALLWSAIINGVLAPFVLVALLLVASDKTIMHGQVSSRVTRLIVGLTTLLMFGAAIGMFVF
jgi:NRAMP (natural resistance-associated macrophage protein)-like metal ion transporter